MIIGGGSACAHWTVILGFFQLLTEDGGAYSGCFATSFEVTEETRALNIAAWGRRRWNIETGFRVEKHGGCDADAAISPCCLMFRRGTASRFRCRDRDAAISPWGKGGSLSSSINLRVSAALRETSCVYVGER